MAVKTAVLTLSAAFLAVVGATTHWEPCKIQCDKNFRQNDFSQPFPLIDVCKRGCDFFTVALISTAHGAIHEAPQFHIVPDDKLSISLSLNEISNSNPLHGYHHRSDRSIAKEEIKDSDPDKTAHKHSSSKETKISPGKHSNNPSQVFVMIPGTQKKTVHNNDEQNNRAELKSTSTINGKKLKDTIQFSHKTSQVSHTNEDKPVAHFLDRILHQRNKNSDTFGAIRIEEVYHPDTWVRVVLQKSAFRGSEGKEEIHEKSLTERIEQAKHSCRRACVVAYPDPSESESCVVGCNLQATTASLGPAAKSSNKPDEGFGPGLSSLKQMQNVAFNFAGQIGRFISTTWSSLISRFGRNQHREEDREKEQVYGSEGATRRAHMPLYVSLRTLNPVEETVEKRISSVSDSQPNPYVNLIGLRKIGYSWKDKDLKNYITNTHDVYYTALHLGTTHKENAAPMAQTDHTPLKGINNHRGCFKQESHHLFRALIPPNTKTSTKFSHSESLSKVAKDQQLDLLECISRKSGLPRWFIALTIFASALVVLYLCFSLTAPPEDIRVVKTKVPEDTAFNNGVLKENFDQYCSEKKKLLPMNSGDHGDMIKINIENV